jgi:hypothetical protein
MNYECSPIPNLVADEVNSLRPTLTQASLAWVRHIERQLATYLGAEVLHFRILASGWQTSVFEFELRSVGGRAKLPIGEPLVLRIYRTSEAAERSLQENWIMCRLSDVGYPVPRPYLFETERQPWEHLS